MFTLALQTSSEHPDLLFQLLTLGVLSVFMIVALILAARVGRRRFGTFDRLAAHLGGIEQQLTRIADAIERHSKRE